MKKRLVKETIEIPENVDVNILQNSVHVQGPLGKLKRDFSRIPVSIRRENGTVLIEAFWPDKKRMAMVGTVRSHIRNLITGVLKGFEYKLKIVYAHFPMSVKIEDREVIIENFHGERKARKTTIPATVNVEVTGDDVVVKGIDLEAVSQAAANIQQATRIKKKDPRIFLDGIYVYKKGEMN